jgi:hypothetical protein
MMAETYRRVLVEAQEARKISKNLDVKEAAYFIAAGWHGAIIQMKLEKSITPLKNRRKFVFEHILKK